MDSRANIWKMYLFMFLRGMQFFVAILIPFYTDWGHISFFQVMILQSIFVIALFLFDVPTGAIADRFGRKTSLMLSGIFNALGILIYASYPNFYVFIIGEIFWAFGIAFMSGASDAIVYESLKKEGREKESMKIIGRFRSFDILAIGIAAPIGSLLVPYLGLRGVELISAIPPFLAFLVACTLKEPERKETMEKKNYFSLVKSGMGYFKKHKTLKILAFDQISIAILVFIMLWLYQPILRDMGMDIKYFGFIAFGICMIEVFIMNSYGFMEKTFKGRKNYLLWSAIIAGAGAILVAFTKNLWIAVSVFILAMGIGFPRETMFINYMNKHIESHNRATVLSSISMIKSLALAMIYLVIGYAAELSLYWTLFGVGVLILVSQMISSVEEKHLVD